MPSAQSDRTFGVELECLVRHSLPADDPMIQYEIVGRHIESHTALQIIHPGLPLYNDYYCGRLKRHDWIVMGDVSISLKRDDFRYSRERLFYPDMSVHSWARLWDGVEIVSPVLTESSWENVDAIMKAIETPPMAVIHNKSTSTHIHIGIQPYSKPPLDAETGLHDLKHVAAVYYIFETYLNLLCPDHRVNTFCHRIRRSFFARKSKTQREFCQKIYSLQTLQEVHSLMNCEALDDVDEIMASRYFGVNFENCKNVWEKWTVEFRSHEGTKNSSDLRYWGKLLMRLFDQAVASDWAYIMFLCDSSESFSSEWMCGHQDNRDLNSWRKWTAGMHILFVMFLAGPALRDKHMNPVAPDTLEKFIFSQPPQMTDEEYADIDVRPAREEEILLQNLVNHITAREGKFKPLYERYMKGTFQDWSSDNPRDDLPADWVDYPNPSGVVLDSYGLDTPFNVWRVTDEDYAQYPVV